MVEKKLEDVKNIVKTKDPKDQFKKVYAFTTENIDGYIKFFDLKDKSLLTVGSSSDQVLNAFYSGCKDITLIDINEYTKEYFYLKKSAIETLTYKQFFRFMSLEGTIYRNFLAFNKKMFNKVLKNIEDDESKEFWTAVLEQFKTRDIKKIFSYDVPFTYELKKLNNYLRDEKAYNKMQSKIKDLKPEFINANIYHYNLNKNYDNIFLSNIADYYEVDKTHKLYKRLKNNLNDNGSILIAYVYGTNQITSYTEMSNMERTKKIFDDAKVKSFKGREDIELRLRYDDIDDDILVYKKK